MADVAVRFTVQNAEAVRQALQALGKDGAAALKQLETGAAAPNAGLNAVSTLIDAAKSRVTGLALSIGPAGQALIQLGPAGMAAAAAIGFLSSAFAAANERANQMADWARRIREAAETAGVTAEQFQVLARAGQQVGMDLDRSSQFIDRLTLSVEELRRGGGQLFDTLARMDAGLVREVAAARSTAEAINILARAYAQLNTQGERNRFATAVGGRGAIGGGQLLEQIAGAGGLQGLEDAARRAGRVIGGETLESMTRLRRETEEFDKAADKAWDRIFGGDALNRQHQASQAWLRLAEAVERVKNALPGLEALTGGAPYMGVGPPPGSPGTTPPRSAPTLPPWVTTVTPEPSTASTAAADLALMRQRNAILGDAITLTEQRALREAELLAITSDASLSEAERARRIQLATRAMGSFNAAQLAVIASTRQRLGIVTEEQVTTARLADLQMLRGKGFITTDAEMAAAERLVRREVRETAEALAVRNSQTPGLTRLAIDSDNLTKSLDQGLTGALRGATSTMLDMLKGTKSLSDGFAELASRILDAITEALILKSIVGPISGGISAGINSFVAPSAMGNVFAGGGIVPFARGGVVHRPSIFRMANGGLASMSENEPEAIMPLRRLSSGRLGVESAGGGANVQVNIINNHGSAKVSQREESDGRGGRKITAVIEEMVGSALGRPGSRATQALVSGQGMTRL